MKPMRWNRRLAAALMAVLLFTAAGIAAGCVKKPADVLIKPKSKEMVASKLDQNIIQLLTESYVPYGYLENGEIKGIAVDVVSEAFRREGFTVELSILPWTRALQMVEDGDTDGIYCAFYSEQRAVFMQYMKEPIAYEAQYVYTLKNSPVSFDGTMESLKPYRVGAQQDYYYGEAFENAKSDSNYKIEQVVEVPTNIQKLLDGRIDAMVDHHLSMLYYLKQMNLQDRIVEQPIPLREPSGLYLAFTKKRFIDQDLIRRVDEELVKMKQDGTYQGIVDRYTR